MQTFMEEHIHHEEMTVGHLYEIEDDRGGILRGNYEERSDSHVTLKHAIYTLPSGHIMPYPSWCISFHRIVSCKKFHF